MKVFVRIALFIVSLATITPVAKAGPDTSAPAPVQQDSTASWANG